ncbi:uncharacterized protein LOC110991148 [Acanthaster planci]|uniref:Uncharacterized protein LOC110991148 n=1 Tax=Acanthaster planci TaxID=133434 RepID=A0A8B8A7N7_ACAPL|nr:uncharacterized protein LOC110991148 [Acanthaster planci]
MIPTFTFFMFDKKAGLLFPYCVFVGVLLFYSYHPVNGDVTLEASASQSHPMEGHSTSLICRVRSMNQSQVIMWSKDQRSITWGDTMGQMMSSRFELDMTSVNITAGMLTSYTLTISEVTRDDDGRYECQVLQENEYGYSAMASETVVISVLYFPSSSYPYCSLNGSQTLLTGTELTVTCVSEIGNPQISAMWVTEDGPFPKPVYHTVESPSMMVSELQLAVAHDLQGATYVCRVTSPAYPESDRTCSLGPLRIMDWPIVKVVRSLERVNLGDDIHFLCSSDPAVPTLSWETIPKIDPHRLEEMDGGAILTIRNVQRGDNMTSVVCRVPYRDTYVESRSTIVLNESPHVLPTQSFHATSRICVPWFAAFLFTVVVNFTLCAFIVRLLMRVNRLTSQLNAPRKGEPDQESLRDVGRGPTLRSKRESVLTWPASLNSNSSNWSMRSETQLRDQRRQSWFYLPPPGDDSLDTATTRPQTYTELLSDTLGKVKSQKKPRKAVSLQNIHLTDSDSYVTPNTRSKPRAKSASSSQPKSSRQNGNSTTGPASKSRNSSNEGSIGTIGHLPMQQPSAVERSSYMDLNDTTKDSPPPRQTYQALKKTPNSSRYAPKLLKSSMKANSENRSTRKKSTTFDMDDMMGDSGIYGEGSMLSTDHGKPAQRQDSLIGESASYMPLGTVPSRHSAASLNHHRSGTMSSDSSTDAHCPSYSVPPAAGTSDDGMGDAIYKTSPDTKAGGKGPTRPQSRATVSSRAPMPAPTACDPERADLSSNEESYREPYSAANGKNPVYHTLEPDQGSYNYGADISSENESYQGPDPDWRPADKTSKAVRSVRMSSSTSETSYLELPDVDGEIKGYIDMTKVKSDQLQAPSKVTKAPSKVTKKIVWSDSEGSLSEYYQPMDGALQSSEYAVPPSNKPKQEKEQDDSKEANISESCLKKEQLPSAVERKPKRKARWMGLFKN